MFVVNTTIDYCYNYVICVSSIFPGCRCIDFPQAPLVAIFEKWIVWLHGITLECAKLVYWFCIFDCRIGV